MHHRVGLNESSDAHAHIGCTCRFESQVPSSVSGDTENILK